MAAHTRSVRRWTWVGAVLAISACASGSDPATSATTFSASASATATATAPATASTDPATGDTSECETAAASDGTSGPTSGDTTASGSSDTDTTGGESSGGTPSEQPEDGMYSQCVSVVDCIGLTACLTVNDSSGAPIDPFCTAGSCESPLAQCDPTPGGTAVPICLPVDMAGVMDNVCALDCSMGQQCPAGMECKTLAEGAICS